MTKARLLSLLWVPCFSFNSPPALAETPAPPSATASAHESVIEELNQAKIEGVRHTLVEAMSWQKNAKAFRYVGTRETPTGGRTEETGEVRAPDRMHVIMKKQIGDEPLSVEEVTTIKDRVFIKEADGKWIESAAEKRNESPAFKSKAIEDVKKHTEVKLIGRESLEGVPTEVYEFKVTNPLGLQLTLAGKAWVSPSDGFLRRMEAEGDLAGRRNKTTVVYTDYNSAMKIEAPATASK